MSTVTPTAKEMAVLNEAASINFKLQWLGAHPGKTRADYNAGLKDSNSEVWHWRREQGRRHIERECKAWLKDHRGKTSTDYDRITSCGASDAEVAALQKWRESK